MTIHQLDMGWKVGTLGDPHLGRSFVTGVPLHRRGEREEWIWQDFEASILDPREMHLHVNMGDLFDRAVVSPGIVLRAARAYIRAAHTYQDRRFVILKGNHDAGGDAEATTSFDLLKEIVSHVDNILVVDQPTFPQSYCPFGFIPWMREMTSAEAIEDIPFGTVAVFGHWDIHSFGHTRNLVPTEMLEVARCPIAFTGHDHTPQEVERNGVRVIGTGSMQPYTHGEDPSGEIYRTVTVTEAQQMINTENLCLRVMLGEGETLPDVDCLQLTMIRSKDVSKTKSVDLGTLNMASMWKEAMVGVPETLRDTLYEKFRTREVK